MAVICKLCNKSFDKQINNRHLKYAHNTTTSEYKAQFGNDSLSCPEYRAEKSKALSGKNNPNYKNNWSQEQKDNLSNKLKGREAHNKGVAMSSEQKVKLSEKTKERFDNGFTIDPYERTEEIRKKLSDSVTKYASEHKDEIRERTKKAIQTKKDSGYDFAFFKGRKHTEESKAKIIASTKLYRETRKQDTITRLRSRIEEYYEIIHCEDNYIYTLKCKKCKSTIQVTAQNFHDCKFIDEDCARCPTESGTSRAELEIRKYIGSLGVDPIFKTKSVIWPFELDIHIPNLNVAIEYDGLFWHGENQGRGRLYHLTKTNKCLEKGIKLIHIFEDEWVNNKEIVVSRINNLLNVNMEKVFARKCSVIAIDSKTANKFLKENHIQGSGRSNYCYGLMYNDELISVMTFNNSNVSRRSKDWEINRFASKLNISVIGGASKIFKHFIKTHNPRKVVSFADKRWGNGSVYQQLGFNLMYESPPNYWYFKTQNKRYHRWTFRKSELIKEGFDKKLTEWEIMQQKGYDRIWDCGHAKWVWDNPT